MFDFDFYPRELFDDSQSFILNLESLSFKQFIVLCPKFKQKQKACEFGRLLLLASLMK